MAPRTPSCRSGCPPWTWKRMTWCSCPNLSGEFSLWNPPVINSDPCDSYHVICHMRERDNQWKLYMCLLYVFYNVYMYVPKNAKNTSQNQCVCVCGCGCGICKWYLQARPQMPTASPESLANTVLLASRIWDAMLLSNDLSSFMWCCFLRFQMIDDGDGEISVEELLCSKMVLGW